MAHQRMRILSEELRAIVAAAPGAFRISDAGCWGYLSLTTRHTSRIADLKIYQHYRAGKKDGGKAGVHMLLCIR